jgi:hypothetical protein
MQEAYRIRVSETASFDGSMVWESGKVKSEESNLVSYDGPDSNQQEGITGRLRYGITGRTKPTGVPLHFGKWEF